MSEKFKKPERYSVVIPPPKDKLVEVMQTRHRYLINQLLAGEISSLEYTELLRKLSKQIDKIRRGYDN